MKFFSPIEETKVTQNRLPHWQQRGACYFVTFRLADSLPTSLTKGWKEERELWLRQHPKPWDCNTEQEYHKHFSTRIDHWLDQGHGSCLLSQSRFRRIVSDCLMFFDGERHALHAYVIMPNHVHALVSPHPDWSLDKIMHSWKRQSSKDMNTAVGSSGKRWQKDYFDRLVRDWTHFERCVAYIRRNPVKAALSPEAFTLFEDEIARCV